jgi:hypothetical protein
MPPCALLVMCCDCGKGLEAPLPLDQATFALFLARQSWFVSVLSPPGQGPEKPLLFGALCMECAPKVFPPEVMKAAEERRQQMLAGRR